VLKFLNSLFGRVVIALLIGVAIGALYPQFAQSLRPLGDGFLKLIKMVIGPIVFCVVVSGMAHAGDLRKVGRVGLKAVIYFEVMTTIALVIGAVLAYATRPGAGMNIDLHSLDPASLSTYTEHAKSLKDTAGFLLKIIPDTAFNAFATGDILQILVFSVLFGSALSLLGSKGQRVGSMIDELAQVFFRVMGFIIKLAPLGVLGAIAFTTGKYGVESLKQLGTSSWRRSACSARLPLRPASTASSRSSSSACWCSCFTRAASCSWWSCWASSCGSRASAFSS